MLLISLGFIFLLKCLLVHLVFFICHFVFRLPTLLYLWRMKNHHKAPQICKMINIPMTTPVQCCYCLTPHLHILFFIYYNVFSTSFYYYQQLYQHKPHNMYSVNQMHQVRKGHNQDRAKEAHAVRRSQCIDFMQFWLILKDASFQLQEYLLRSLKLNVPVSTNHSWGRDIRDSSPL